MWVTVVVGVKARWRVKAAPRRSLPSPPPPTMAYLAELQMP